MSRPGSRYWRYARVLRSGIHRVDVAAQVALYHPHRRGFDKETQEGILLLEAQVLAAQAGEQVVEGADDNVRLVLSRRSQPRRQVQVLHQFHAADEGVVGLYHLAVEVAQVE